MMKERARTILLVEDNPDDAELLLRSFVKFEFTNPVVVVRDGVEALDYLFARNAYAGRSKTDLPRLILLDVKLPRMDGMEFLKNVREHPLTRLIPVVALTTSVEEKDKRTAYALGVNSYLRKPVNFFEFMELVRNLGAYWLNLNESPFTSV